MQAAILRVKLEHLASSNDRRRANAAYYDSHIQLANLTTPQVSSGIEHVYHQYTITHPDRDRIAAHLKSSGIASAILYPMAVHQQPAYATARCTSLNHTERVVRELLCLPVHPQLSHEERVRVVEAINSVD